MMSTLYKHRRQLSVGAVYLAMLGLLAVLRPDFFHKQFLGVFIESAPVLICAVGMTWVILARQIDISIGSQFSVCGVLAGVAAQMHAPMVVVVIVALLAGGLFGAVNGFLVGFVELPSIVVTLAMMVLLRESLSWIRQGEEVNQLPDYFQWFGSTQQIGQWIILIVAVLIWMKFFFASRYSTAGRSVFAVGSDFEAARLAGLRPRHVTFAVFVLMGILTGVAALLNAIRFPSVDVKFGTGVELKVIAAVVIGGTAISGGRGSFIGSLLGVLLLGTIGSMLLFLASNHPGATYWERAVQGIIILAAVATDALERKRPA
jgi:rhamnose transport system permease protein